MTAIQGADAAALSMYFPAYLGFPGLLPTDHYSRAAPAAPAEVAGLTEFVSPGFFDTFGIARLRGRDFDWTDAVSAPPVVMVSEALAHTLFPENATVAGFGCRPLCMKEFEIIGASQRLRSADPGAASASRPSPILQEPMRAQFRWARSRRR